MAQTSYHFELAALHGSRIDAEKGVIHGVAVITAGKLRPGDVRTFEIDRTTLEQVKACASEYQGGLKVRLAHEGNVSDYVGTLKNFRIEGDVLRADLHLLQHAPLRAYVLEIAEKMAESFGMSIDASGKRETIGGKTFLRCFEIRACDIVDVPASNPDGLFDARRGDKGTSPDHISFPMTKEELSALLADALKPINERLQKLETATSAETLKAQFAADRDEAQEKLAAKLIATFKLGAAPGAAAGASGSPTPPTPTFTKFEQVVLSHKAAGKKHNEAVNLAIEAHGDLYKAYLARVQSGEIIRF